VAAARDGGPPAPGLSWFSATWRGPAAGSRSRERSRADLRATHLRANHADPRRANRHRHDSVSGGNGSSSNALFTILISF